MKYKIPDKSHRITLDHDGSLNGTEEGFAQGQEHNRQIISFAREKAGTDRFFPVEVFYKRTDIESESTEEDFDALMVDTTKGRLWTMPPYDEIDPNWKETR